MLKSYMAMIWWSISLIPLLRQKHAGALSSGLVTRICPFIRRGRLPVVIEATKRLRITLGRTVAVAGVVTGPFTLASHLKGQNITDALERAPEKAGNIVELAGKVCLQVCKSYCELEVDAIVLAESVLPQLPQRYFPMALSVLGPLYNVIRFYNGLLLLLATACTRESVGLLTKMEADAMAVDSSIEAHLRQDASRCIVGQTIPCSVVEGPKEQLTAHMDNHLKGERAGAFVSTEWQVPYDTPPENMHQITKYVRGL
jgi:uroporphyrinogen decarboxylase